MLKLSIPLIKNWISIFFGIKDTKSSTVEKIEPSTNQLKKSKLDEKKLYELLIQEYSIRLLECLRQEIENDYDKLRIIEKSLKAHTAEHIKITQKMHFLMDDLTKIKQEINGLTEKIKDLHESIKKDLQLNLSKIK